MLQFWEEREYNVEIFGSEIITTVTKMDTVFWVVMPCRRELNVSENTSLPPSGF
jgi:hypothetical protein